MTDEPAGGRETAPDDSEHGPSGPAPAESAAPTPAMPSFHAATPAVRATLARPLALGFVVTLGGLIAIGLAQALTSLSSVLISITLALFIALGIDPVVRSLQAHGVRRGWAIVIVSSAALLVFLGVLALLVPVVVQQLYTMISSIPAAIDAFTASDAYRRINETFGDSLSGVLQQFEALLIDPNTIATVGGGVLQISIGIVGGLSGALIVFVLTLYFIVSLTSIKQAFYQLAPAWSRPQLADLTERITQSVGGYLKGMVILAFFNSVVAFILHLVLGLPFPALMAVVAFVLTIIPLVGTALFWIFASVLALFTNPWLALIFFVAYFIYMEIEAYVLTPRVMTRAIAVPGILVVIGALVGGTLLGLIGALLAVPVTASILLIVKEVFIPRQDAKATAPPL